MAGTLGISLGTRAVGLAVFLDGRLIDWRTRTFWDAWSDEKQAAIIATITDTVIRYDISAIAIKTPIPEQCSENINALIQGIQSAPELHSVPIMFLTIRDLKKRYTPVYRTHKNIFIGSLVEKYPQLGTIKQGKNGRTAYHDKIFEAIECGEYAIEMGL